MVEIIAKKTWKMLAKPRSAGARLTRVLPPGLWVALAVIGLLGGRWAWVHASRPARAEIANDYGSIRLFIGARQINHAGDQFTYIATGDKGYELFRCDLMTGQRRSVTQLKYFGPTEVEHNLIDWPWSPDDKLLVYSEGDRLVICPSDQSADASAKRFINLEGVSDLVWLNPSRLVYIVGQTNLGFASRQPDGEWKAENFPESKQTHRLPSRISSLTAVATNTVAWLQDNQICRFDFDQKTTNAETQPVISMVDRDPVLPTNHLVLRLDASTLQQADQTPVNSLADLSPEKNDALMFGTAPTYNAPEGARGLNGKGTIHFAANNTLTNANGLKTRNLLGIAGSTPRTVFVVVRPDAGREMKVSMGDTGSKGAYFGILDGDGLCYLPSGWWGADNPVQRMAGNHWDILSVVYDGTTQKGFMNGVLGGVTTFPYNTADKEVEIGVRPPNHDGAFGDSSDGDFAELLVYNGALNEADRQQVEKYLSAKWLGAELSYDKNPYLWLDPQLNGITGFSYSKRTGNILLTRAESEGNSLWLFDSETTNFSRLAVDNGISEAQWVGPKECAYISQSLGQQEITVMNASGKEKRVLLNCPRLDGFTSLPGGERLLFTGIVSNELSAGIWQLDTADSQLQLVVPGSDFSSPLDKGIAPLFSSFQTPSGQRLDYLVYFPAHFDRHKKYPLLLGDTTFYYLGMWPHSGREWMPALAASGAFVVAINRPSWFGDLDQWGDNVMALYQQLKQNPCIDRERVYLYGSSAETAYLGKFMASTPDLWRGAFLANPSNLPNFSQSPRWQKRPKILISAGENEHENDRLKQYQTDAAKYGVLVELAVEPNEGHIFGGNAAYLDRLRRLMRFVSEE